MSLPIPSWRLAPRRSFFSASSLPIRTRTPYQTRPISGTPSHRAKDDAPPKPTKPTKPNPFLEKYLRDNPSGAHSANARSLQEQEQGMRENPGDLPASSVFEDDVRAEAQLKSETATPTAPSPSTGPQDMPTYLQPNPTTTRDPAHSRRILDPNPNARHRYERKKTIALVRRGGRLTKAEYLLRTERSHTLKSHEMKTSVKKLGMLARQIQGKRIEDAITQMRFSRKKVAVEVGKLLGAARDEAVVMGGMGLGQVRSEEEALTVEARGGAEEKAAPEGTVDKPLEIQLKNGKRHAVSDRSAIYIDQAWVGRGKYGKLPDYRARGRVFVMRTPFTSMTLVLKEEATRVRQHEEREAKRKRRIAENVWVHLPDRPIQQKSQYYSW